MKKLIILIIAIVLFSSCTYKSCPTYAGTGKGHKEAYLYNRK